MVIDTNILIYYLNQQLTDKAKMEVENAILQGSAISIITRIEILGWQGHTEASLVAAKNLLSLLEEIDLNQIIANQCIALRKMYKIKLPDAIIAATALTHQQVIMSRNEDDFIKIAGLTVNNPFS